MSQQRGHVLLTAFRPFGVFGTVNRSQQVCDRVAALLPRANIQYEVLAVSEQGIQRLKNALNAGPLGVIMTGEAEIGGSVVLEARAFDPKWQFVIEGIGGIGSPFRKAVCSPYAAQMAHAFRGVQVHQSTSVFSKMINGFFCNKANWEAIRWSESYRKPKEEPRPVCFVHLSMWKSKDMHVQVNAISRLLRRMMSDTGLP
jgi:hypothetical protein